MSTECADVPDVSNMVRSDDLSNVASRAEALRQCKLGFSTGRDTKVLVQVVRHGLSCGRVSVQCRESLQVSRRLSDPQSFI